MARKKKSTEPSAKVTTKKCPYCYTYLPANAERCDACGKRVGEVDATGWAKKPVDITGYLVAIAACGGFAWFVWWAFLSK